MNGFTLNGIHCSTYKLVMLSKDRTVLPQVDDMYLQVPGRDGSYLFNRKLEDRHIEIICGLVRGSSSDLRTTIRQIASWLFYTQKVRLIFDDEPDKYYMAKYDGSIGLDQKRTNTLGEFTIKFRCEPYAYSLTTTQNESTDAVFLFPNFPIAPGAYILNEGTAPVFPKFTTTFTAAATEYKLVLGNYFMRVVRNFIAGDVLVIDHAISKVTVNGLNAMVNLDLSSRFFSLPVGLSQILISPVNVANITTNFNERWF